MLFFVSVGSNLVLLVMMFGIYSKLSELNATIKRLMAKPAESKTPSTAN